MRHFSFLFLIAVLTVGALPAYAETAVTTSLTADQTWTKEGSPYVIQKDIDVPAGVTLNIEPGTTVKFKHGPGVDTRLFVYGRLHVGEAGQEKVRFMTSADDSDGFDVDRDGDTYDPAFPYSWDLYFMSSAGSSITNASFSNFGIISPRNSDVVIRDLETRHSQGTVSATGGKVEIYDSEFSDLATGGVSMDSGEMVITSSVIRGVRSGNAISITYGTLRLDGIRVEDARANHSLYAAKSSVSVADSVFDKGGADWGIRLLDSSSTFSSTTVSGFAKTGLSVFGGSFSGERMSIERNAMGGITVEDNFYSKSNVSGASLSGSRITGNGDFGLHVSARAGMDARNNWWGSPSGPFSSEYNATGTGDKIWGNPEFRPWLEADPWAPPAASSLPAVMFIPGFEASRLYVDTDMGQKREWEPSGDSSIADLYLDEAGAGIYDGVYTTGVIDEVYGYFFLENIYKSFLADLKKWKEEDKAIAEYSVIPYDWRLSIQDILRYGSIVEGKLYYAGSKRNAAEPFIYAELRRLAAATDGKITIIGHSNGGLVAKALLKKLEDEHDPLLQKIDKLLLVAVPQTGTPQAVGALLHGFDQSLGPFGSALSAEAARKFGRNMPGAYPLLPSSSYWSNQGSEVSTPVVSFQGGGFAPLDAAIAKYGRDIDSADELAGFLRGDEGRTSPADSDLKTPAVVNSALMRYGEAQHAAIDLWTPPSHITVHQVAGWGEETLASIKYRPKVKRCLERSAYLTNYCIRYEYGWTYSPEMVIDGDGTVVTPSALAMSTSSPNVKRWWVDLGKYNSPIVGANRKHKNILEVSDVSTLVKDVVLNINPALSQIILADQPPSNKLNLLQFILHSPLDIKLIDSSGNELSSTTKDIPGGRYIRFGEVQYVSVPKEANPTVKLVGVESGYFDLDIAEVEDGGTVATTKFASIESSTSTLVEINLPDGTIQNASDLSVDRDGNGTVDVSIEPVLNGTSAPKRPLTVIANDISVELGSSIPNLTYGITGFADSDTATTSVMGMAECTTTAAQGSPVGSYPIICLVGTLTSEKYHFASFVPATLNVVYRFDGFSQPINDTTYHPEQARSIFKAGSTVPVKFQLKNTGGASVQAVTVPLWINPQRIGPMSGTVGEAVSALSATAGSVYKWDSASQQYVYNWSTKGLLPGYWYMVSVKLDDRTTKTVIMGLK